MDVLLNFDNLNVTKHDVYVEMGYGGTSPDRCIDDMADALFAKAREIVRPRFHFHFFDGSLSGGFLLCGDVRYHIDDTIASLMRNAERFVAFAATAGNEYQHYYNKLADEGDPLLVYVWDAMGSCIAEATGDVMERYLENELGGTPHTNRFSPGYCGWHVSEQKLLFSQMPVDVCGIRLNDSSLMYPIKSISGIIGCGRMVDTRKYGCSFCNLTNCYKKRKK